MNLAAGGWTGKRTAKDWIGRVRKHIFPVVGSRQIDLITAQEIRDKVLLPVSAKHPETARRLRDSLNQIFVFAQESEWVDQNPIDKIPRRRLPRPAPVHHEALAWVEIPQLAAEIDVNTTDMRRSTRECLMFTLLTAARSGEARGATWREISDDLEVWTIPASRMKARQFHRVPLSAQVRKLLRVIRYRVYGDDLPDGGDLVFPSSWSDRRELSWGALLGAMRRLGAGSTHGLRSSFRDWCEERSGASFTAVELSLAHSVGSQAERSYRRTDLLDKRRVLMQQWADFALPNGFIPF